MAKEAADYSASGVNLCNPPEVKEAIEALQEWKTRLAARESEVAKLIPEDLTKDRDWAAWQVEDLTKSLRAMIEKHGGYQDIETETYALFQTRKTAEYNTEALQAAGDGQGGYKYGRFFDLVIEQAINVNALKGQVKGGLIEQSELEVDGVITYKETQAFILKVPEAK